MRIGIIIMAPPPPPPPPYTQWRGIGLTSDKCSAMLRDPTHVFRRMWAAESWGRVSHALAACHARLSCDRPLSLQRACVGGTALGYTWDLHIVSATHSLSCT